MFTYYTKRHFIATAALVCMTSLMFVGCDSGNTSAANKPEQIEKKSERTFTFHKPEQYNTAISRIRELHDAISGGDPLPSPIEYQVQEIVHGTGSGAHSHFYIYDPTATEEHDFGEEEDHEQTGESIIDVKVDPMVELKDVVRWLPKIASGGDMNESDWVQVNDISKEWTPALVAILENAADEEEFRVSYRAEVDSFASHLSTLEKLVK